MKLISLNAWCGVKYEALKQFIEREAKDTDIFCLQEIRNGRYLRPEPEIAERISLFVDLKEILSDFTGYFSEMVPGVGLASFVRNNITVEKVETKDILVTADLEKLKTENGSLYYPRLIQSIYLKDINLTVHNFHGIPKSSKKDTPERELQTDRLLEIIRSSKTRQILIGDFNLNIDTSAIARIGEELRELVKESIYKTTRNHNYGQCDIMPFADYAFISKNIEVIGFAVLPDEVSDHLALSLEFK